jgi:hypothetical protein
MAFGNFMTSTYSAPASARCLWQQKRPFGKFLTPCYRAPQPPTTCFVSRSFCHVLWQSLPRMALGQHPPCSDRPCPSYRPPLAGPTNAGTPRPGHCLLRTAGPTHALHPIHLHDDVQPPENSNSSSTTTSPTDSIKCQMPAATKAAVTAGTATLSDHYA